MKITKFRIQDYKAIKDTFIQFNSSLNPIIGVNESGKTTVLQAILAFDQGRDKYNGGKHLRFQNKYSIDPTKECKVTATIKLEKFEIEEFMVKNDLKSNHKDFHPISELKSHPEIELMRVIRENGNHEFKVISHSFHDSIQAKFVKFIAKQLPIILYFDDFTDRVPEEVIFPEDYENTSKLSLGKNRDWQEIIVEIFRRAKIEKEDDGIDRLASFIKMTNEDIKDGILSDIQDVLNKEIINEWKKIKKSGLSQLADDSDNLELELKYDKRTFTFKVKDKSYKDKKRIFNISDRSKGFQWFFNYMIKLKFNPRYKNKIENSIFLLDEPGSYLHSSAQSELLKELVSVSKNNTIIYCTHSQYLLNPSTIKLGSIRIASKIESEVSVTNFGSFKQERDKGALSPLYQALGLNFSQDFIGRVVITEGITDLYFFKMFKEHRSEINSEFSIIPGSGSGNLSNLISLGLGFADNFLVLFDNDRGAKAIKKYTEEFGNEITNYFHLYSKEVDFKLESFFDKADINMLARVSGTEDPKKSLALLYYDLKDKQSEVFQNLSKHCMDKLMLTIKRLNEL